MTTPSPHPRSPTTACCTRRPRRSMAEAAAIRDRVVRQAGHLQPEGVHPAHVPVQRHVRLLHVRPAAGARRHAVPRSRRRAEDRPPGGTRRLSRGAVHARRAARGPVRGRPRLAARTRLRLDRALRRRDGRARARRDRPAPARQRRRAARRRARAAPTREPEPGDDDRVGRPTTSTPTATHPTRRRHVASRRSRPPANSRSRSRPASSSASARAAADQLAALEAIADSHRRHGHVQEVIVQNFLPKERTAMRGTRACPSDDYLWAIAAARLILPSDVHLQAPPNLTDDFGVLLDAGIDDWGGVSPVTADHVNPERPWPDLDLLREVTETRGFVLAPRLTIYPEFVADRDRWLDPALHFPVMDRADAEWLGPRRPGPGVAGADHRRRHGRRRRRVRARRPPLDRVVLGFRQHAADAGPDRPLAGRPIRRTRRCGRRGARRHRRRARNPASTRSSPCSRPAGPTWSPSPTPPIGCARSSSATRSPGSPTGTSTTRTCARSSASSAGSRRVRCR